MVGGGEGQTGYRVGNRGSGLEAQNRVDAIAGWRVGGKRGHCVWCEVGEGYSVKWEAEKAVHEVRN